MKRFLLCLGFFIIIFSCTENGNSENQIKETDSNFFALTIGNSWVYKNYIYNSVTQKYDYTGVIDSLSIVGFQNFFGETYYKIRRLTSGNENNITFCNPNGEHFEFLREFNGNLINNEGIIRFTYINYDERMLQENQWGTIFEKLTVDKTTLRVEAGEFECINSERYAKNLEGKRMPGIDRFYYAKGIGLVYDTTSFISNATPTIIRRLDSYKVQ